MSHFIKVYFTSSMLNMFRTLIHLPSGACVFSIISPHWLCVLVSMCVGVSVWLVGVVSVWQAEAHGNTIEKSQAHDDRCINVRNILSIEEVKLNLINCDIKLVSYSSSNITVCSCICVLYI